MNARIVAYVDRDMQELIPGFLAGMRDYVTRMRAALTLGDMEELRESGHKLKGCGLLYGFPPISQLGQAIEQGATEGARLVTEDAVGALDAYLEMVDVEYVDEV